MQTTASLSLDQAPPINIPFRFFLTAPLFGIAAALMLLYYGPSAFMSRWSPPIISITHLLTLGYMSMVMMGAMLQMLPVMAGAPVPRVTSVGGVVHSTLTFGSLALAVSFVTGNPPALMLAAFLLSTGGLVFLVSTGIAFYRAKSAHQSIAVFSMKLALLSLLVALVLGVMLIGDYSGYWSVTDIASWTDLHLSWGFAGWLALLFIGVSYQLVPMFQVTPEYPALIKRWLTPLLFLSVMLWTLSQAGYFIWEWPELPAQLAFLLLIVLIAIFIFVTVNLQRERRRKVPDMTLTFWRLGFALALVALLLLVVGKDSLGHRYPMLAGMLILPGVAMSLINGMLYRIVPFLSWFHLQHKQLSYKRFDIQLPHMKAFISDKLARVQFYLHALAVLAALFAVYFPDPLVYVTGVLFVLSNSLLFANLAGCVLRYKKQVVILTTDL